VSDDPIEDLLRLARDAGIGLDALHARVGQQITSTPRRLYLLTDAAVVDRTCACKGAGTCSSAPHSARPDDDPKPGDRCKDCGEQITWVGPSQYDWEHVDGGGAVSGAGLRPEGAVSWVGAAPERVPDVLNQHIGFYPAREGDQRPAVKVDDVLVFVYRDEDGTYRVTVDTEDCDKPAGLRVNINTATVFEREVA
jgi:hypothetical protein